MAATPESRVKSAVKKILDAYGAYHFSPVTGGYGKSGVPDIIACYQGRFIGIECKAGRGKPTALQLKEMDKIVSAGGTSWVVNETNIQEVEHVLQILKETFGEKYDE